MASKKPLDQEMLQKAMTVLLDMQNEQPDFVCVLTFASFMDQCLVSLLHCHLVEGSTTDALLKYDREVGTYSVRAKLCYSLGLLPKPIFNNINIIGQIRNLFGHSHQDIDFGDPDVSALCGELVFPEPDPIEVPDFPAYYDGLPLKPRSNRSRFVMVTALLAQHLIWKRFHTPRRDPCPDTYKILVAVPPASAIE